MNTINPVAKLLLVCAFVVTAFTAMAIYTPETSANNQNPYLWPYNQGTNVSFNSNDVSTAWEIWKADVVTSQNVGINGRLRVMGGVTDASTVSEGQAYGILFASLFDDQDTLDGLYLFAKDHFDENGLMNWHIGSPQQLLGVGAATDAEADMAIGLINACVKVQEGAWSSSPKGIDYCQEATNMIDAVYDTEVDKAGPQPFAGLDNNQGFELIPGDLWVQESEYPEGITNLSYFAPGYFTVFGKFTNNANWEAVNDRSYEITDLVQAQPDNCSGLVPNWNQYDGDPQSVPWQPSNSSWWSYDAARFAARIAVDQAWYDTAESRETMNEIGSFFASTGFNNIGEHSMDGKKTGSGPWPFFVANAGIAVWAAPNLQAVNCGTATGSIKESPQSAYNRVLSTKDDPNSYYGNAWRLYSMLVMTGNFPNFYEMANDGTTQPTATVAPTTAPTQLPTTVPTNIPVNPTATTAPTAVPTTVPTQVPTATPPASGNGMCDVTYTIGNEWSTGFSAEVAIKNTGITSINGWSLTWQFAGNQQIGQTWSSAFTQVGQNVTVSDLGYNGTISPNGMVSFGFNGTKTGTNQVPTVFYINGMQCGGVTTAPTATPVPTQLPPTATTAPTQVPPTATTAPTQVPPTATTAPTQVPPTATTAPTQVPPTATPVPTQVPPTATPVPTQVPPTSGSCIVDYEIGNDWGAGFVTDVTITNLGSPTSAWTLTWAFAGNQQITGAWGTTASQSGKNVTMNSLAYNGNIGTVSFGFQGNYSGSNAEPAVIYLNGTACTVQ